MFRLALGSHAQWDEKLDVAAGAGADERAGGEGGGESARAWRGAQAPTASEVQDEIFYEKSGATFSPVDKTAPVGWKAASPTGEDVVIRGVSQTHFRRCRTALHNLGHGHEGVGLRRLTSAPTGVWSPGGRGGGRSDDRTLCWQMLFPAKIWRRQPFRDAGGISTTIVRQIDEFLK